MVKPFFTDDQYQAAQCTWREEANNLRRRYKRLFPADKCRLVFVTQVNAWVVAVEKPRFDIVHNNVSNRGYVGE